MVLVSSFLLVLLSPAFGADGEIVKLQGPIMEITMNKNTMTVNEKQFVWNQKTGFFNDQGTSISADRLKTKSWVYIVAERDNKRLIIEKIYLLPKYIDNKSQANYSFMQ
jgi:hypothetical protein